MGTIRASSYQGNPCTKVSAHVVDGHSARYSSSSNCVLCAHESAAKQTLRRQADRDRDRLARHETHGP